MDTSSPGEKLCHLHSKTSGYELSWRKALSCFTQNKYGYKFSWEKFDPFLLGKMLARVLLEKKLCPSM
jgi:hypothetical protein